MRNKTIRKTHSDELIVLIFFLKFYFMLLSYSKKLYFHNKYTCEVSIRHFSEIFHRSSNLVFFVAGKGCLSLKQVEVMNFQLIQRRTTEMHLKELYIIKILF